MYVHMFTFKKISTRCMLSKHVKCIGRVLILIHIPNLTLGGGYILGIDEYHDDVIQWKLCPRYRPFVREFHRSPVNSPHKVQWRGTLMFSLICAMNKRLSKQSRGWRFETPSCSSWRHCNVHTLCFMWMLLLIHAIWNKCVHILSTYYITARGPWGKTPPV